MHETAAEIACTDAWSKACAVWSNHPSDRRLVDQVSRQLFVDNNELASWQALGLDQASLLRIHERVTATRAATEGTALNRTLVTGALRSIQVISHQRDGVTSEFPPAEAVPALIEDLRVTFDALPRHPFVRAAWLIQAIGAVHPFIDANGGTARFLASMELTRAYLPPFVMTDLQRRTLFIHGLIGGDYDLFPLILVIYDVVQQQVAKALATEPPLADWTAQAFELSSAWIAHTDAAWRRAAAIDVERQAHTTMLDSFVRRGYRIPTHPAPQVVRWRSVTPVPLQFALAVYPARAGDEIWTQASVTASVGHDDSLAPILHNEPVASVFVAAPGEPHEVANGRFEHWLHRRIEQSVRGLGAWM